jgi:hypothetical protein
MSANPDDFSGLSRVLLACADYGFTLSKHYSIKKLQR